MSDKQCRDCKKFLSLDNFWTRQARCKKCRSQYERQYRYKRKGSGPTVRKGFFNPPKTKKPRTDLMRWKNVAQVRVRNAIAAGKLNKAPCGICGEQKVHAHHDSYLEKDFLNIRWFCNRHHRTWHMLFIPEVPAHLE